MTCPKCALCSQVAEHIGRLILGAYALPVAAQEPPQAEPTPEEPS